ncbi:sigma-70 family RNA polymerase sigma factor [Desulfoscipio gibsoniae]|uniref:RNA polymerase sigma factor, FliA/WhiG family n=1 Tax=Desulfoscipio gibsoniae DSM 7213 TaxID=767817 RepID=R4KEL6_9FIRM|nr:FliA/WhiG family RNA polymerase sigma factor [Desulfoscipio gibsoniae]AGL01638.1 RNA polymerase sigma factor, FliA/WhiG family [Desulfoscipio gibsoniae DSM 7213]
MFAISLKEWLSKSACVKRGEKMGDSITWEHYNLTKSSSLKEQLVLEHLNLVKYLAGRLAVNTPSGMDREDLEGYGVIGLLDAIEKYNSKLGTKFANYAYTRIRGAMLDEIRKQNWVPRSKWQQFDKLNKAKDRLLQKGNSVNEKELAQEMGIDSAQLRQLAAEYSNAFSIPLDNNNGQGIEITLAESICNQKSPDPLEFITEQTEKEILVAAIKELSERDRLILALYYQEELTLKEIGSILEVTESRVCQLHSKAIQRLRERLTNLL